MTHDPSHAHLELIRHAPRSFAFDPARNFESWQNELKTKFLELLGDFPDKIDPELQIEWRKPHSAFEEIRFTFLSEKNTRVPCHLLVPSTGKKPFPVVVCLQGHNPGMRISLGRSSSIKDWIKIKYGGRDYAIQAVKQGYAALALEQRCFGERKDQRPPEFRQNNHSCHHATMTALLLGRTMIGERIWDVMRAIDVLASFPELDAAKIACIGHSAGGTIAYYAACLDARIKLVMASGAICTYESSIGTRDHCMDNYIPGVLKWFDMADLAGLIAPRPLVVVAGGGSKKILLEGGWAGVSRIKEIYAHSDDSGQCQLVEGRGGHHFYPEITWPVFNGFFFN